MSNPAYKTANSNYGEPWLSGTKLNPIKDEVPTYSQIVFLANILKLIGRKRTHS